jgi:hypothetical protein
MFIRGKASIFRKRPALFRALGDSDPPKSVSVGGCEYRIQAVLKHGSWAATAVYSDLRGKRIALAAKDVAES